MPQKRVPVRRQVRISDNDYRVVTFHDQGDGRWRAVVEGRIACVSDIPSIAQGVIQIRDLIIGENKEKANAPAQAAQATEAAAPAIQRDTVVGESGEAVESGESVESVKWDAGSKAAKADRSVRRLRGQIDSARGDKPAEEKGG